MNSSKWINTKSGEVLIFDPAVLHRAISEKSRANIHFRFKKRSSDKIKLNLFNNDSLVISKEWRDVLDNSPKVFDETILKKYEKDKDLKSVFLIFCRRMIYNFIFFLPLKSKLYKMFDVRPNLYLRRIFNISS